MNSSTLRRLAADHASLHNSELPPHYLFPSSSLDSSMPDDLTQLTILLTGPQGTPYSQGLWKLFFKIPADYPKSPPKASFRTRIWHPNVEENTGSVCVDTLKKDWQSSLTLRDVLITISCLLIQPNPDSALNATAGHLLQDDYESFARQAILMTSIHAGIPAELREAASAAKRRGEDPGTTISEDTERRPTTKGKSASSSSVVLKKLPQRITSIQSAPLPRQIAQEEDSAGEEDEKSESKENNPMLSPSPVPTQIPRRPTLAKRPLSDLPSPVEPDEDSVDAPLLSPSEQNIANNASPTSSGESSWKGSQLAERSTSVNFTGRSLQDVEANGLAAIPFEASPTDDRVRPAKRVCSEEGKENVSEDHRLMSLPERSLPVAGDTIKASLSAPRKASAPGSLGVGGVKGKSRVGLRRL